MSKNKQEKLGDILKELQEMGAEVEYKGETIRLEDIALVCYEDWDISSLLKFFNEFPDTIYMYNDEELTIVDIHINKMYIEIECENSYRIPYTFSLLDFVEDLTIKDHGRMTKLTRIKL